MTAFPVDCNKVAFLLAEGGGGTCLSFRLKWECYDWRTLPWTEEAGKENSVFMKTSGNYDILNQRSVESSMPTGG